LDSSSELHCMPLARIEVSPQFLNLSTAGGLLMQRTHSQMLWLIRLVVTLSEIIRKSELLIEVARARK
jgi:hypothetical protein